ncbi:MAG: GPGG-motif small membrane protein [Actinomycetota bacterium]|nr:GPGG-motif small membrane protein [Actinomycetota bacterium]
MLAAGGGSTDTILWVIAAILVIAGIVALIRGSVIVGVVLIVLGLLVGPGGVSIFN